ncbi:hypothetical protein [Candidatus Methanoperedens nitratireducens]|uniref:hypothetical protein n=1 Tax=Candidatus Methanoperedens nitratireducens TaxID=1392998 RepID=UPI0015CD2DE2|nr:hypothetical protein [Candidatus Methanoperedens nitroreducens]
MNNNYDSRYEKAADLNQTHMTQLLLFKKSEGILYKKTNTNAMKERLISLSQQNRNNHFLKNRIELRCKCGYCESTTYYDYLTSGEFNIGEPISTISPFISEAVYDETISVTPLRSSKKMPCLRQGNNSRVPPVPGRTHPASAIATARPAYVRVIAWRLSKLSGHAEASEDLPTRV